MPSAQGTRQTCPLLHGFVCRQGRDYWPNSPAPPHLEHLLHQARLSRYWPTGPRLQQRPRSGQLRRSGRQLLRLLYRQNGPPPLWPRRPVHRLCPQNGPPPLWPRRLGHCQEPLSRLGRKGCQHCRPCQNLQDRQRCRHQLRRVRSSRLEQFRR